MKNIEVISILTLKKTVVVDSQKISDATVKSYNPALINTHFKHVNHFENYHYCMIVD